MQPPFITNDNGLSIAESKISHGLLDGAHDMLLRIVKEMPKQWRPASKLPNGRIRIAFWNTQEYEAYKPYFFEHGIGKEFVYDLPSYSKAYYLLAYIAVEQNDLAQALVYINQAIELEPDHPEVLCEKALIVQQMGQIKDAYELYVNAIYSRAWNDEKIQAKAMRGAGIVLEEQGNLEAAAVMLKKSLELDPTNQLAMNELSHIYLKRMEKGRAAQPERKRPWWKFW